MIWKKSLSCFNLTNYLKISEKCPFNQQIIFLFNFKFCIELCDVLNFGFRETGRSCVEKLYQIPGIDRVILSFLDKGVSNYLVAGMIHHTRPIQDCYPGWESTEILRPGHPGQERLLPLGFELHRNTDLLPCAGSSHL